MFVRLALESDFDEIVAMAHENIESTRPDMEWDEDKCRATLYSYIDSASPTFFVVEHERKVIAFMVADMADYRAASGLYTIQEVLFVLPAYRGTRAALILMKHFIAWSERLGAKEIIGGVDNEFQPERTAKFLEHLGFKRVGYAMRRVLANGRQQERSQ